jgi:GntR family transcriptional regulator, uxu operon transcriptional repressor
LGPTHPPTRPTEDIVSTSSVTRPPTYTTDLAELILERCAADVSGPGSRLPTERQLAADLGVTRTMVRHALGLLEAEGRISREVGRGTFLRAGDPGLAPARVERDAGRSGDVGPADVMTARRLIEPQLLPLVVAWASARDFDEMRRCLVGGASADSYDEFEIWDFALHHAIVVASRNPLLVAMYREVERARKGALWGNLKRRSDSRGRRAAYQADHERLVDALSARELQRAMEALDAHLARVEADLLGGGGQRGD